MVMWWKRPSWKSMYNLKEDQFNLCGPLWVHRGPELAIIFLLNAIRWTKRLGTHAGNMSAEHGGKCTPKICRHIFLRGDEIMYIVKEDSYTDDSVGISLTFQPLHQCRNYSVQQVSRQSFCAACTPSPSADTLSIYLWYGNDFPANLICLFCLVRPLLEVKHSGKHAALIVRNLEAPQAPSVMVELSLH